MENQDIQNNGTAPEQQQERTFTQEQVNAFVGKRLAEQKASLESELGKRESELIQREMTIRAKELLQEKELPKDLADVLRYDDEDSLVKAIETIERTKGFNNRAKPERIIENKLPEIDYSLQREELDSIGDAFKMKG